ncbi:hypothetical protein PY650_35710 [Rhizobium calliandrae]|uniref:PsbP C-terminal domain-containing protein n=1 Tax=Rhizobium calliandrae TaxID=1312182 RepID=A0ABT7KQD7_9HYPH|nr:hypothetical protein [Rhizobium calliandrae]MDL2410797.1 hypothetical protein [Rhizobium calliandrae]
METTGVPRFSIAAVKSFLKRNRTAAAVMTLFFILTGVVSGIDTATAAYKLAIGIFSSIGGSGSWASLNAIPGLRLSYPRNWTVRVKALDPSEESTVSMLYSDVEQMMTIAPPDESNESSFNLAISAALTKKKFADSPTSSGELLEYVTKLIISGHTKLFSIKTYNVKESNYWFESKGAILAEFEEFGHFDVFLFLPRPGTEKATYIVHCGGLSAMRDAIAPICRDVMGRVRLTQSPVEGGGEPASQ